jgi:midasin (ATPase involved in ribosome maturation)
VSAAQQYRENAAECVGWARIARTDKERATFLQMARTWIEAAERLESHRPRVISDDPKNEIAAK